MELLRYALLATIALLGLKGLRFVLMWQRLIGVRLRLRQATLIEASDECTPLGAIFAAADQVLSALGFRFSHAQSSAESGVNTAPLVSHVYVHDAARTHASVTPATLPDGTTPFNVEFTTHLADGRVIATTDGVAHWMAALPPWHHLHDQYLGSLERQWQAHQRTLRAVAAGQARVLCSAADHVRHTNRFFQAIIANQLARGWVVPSADPGVWHYGVLRAFQITRQMLAGTRRQRARLKERRRHGGEASTELRVAADMAALARLGDAEQHQGSRWLAHGAFSIVSLVAFGLGVGLVFSWRALPILLAVLIFHELGHLLGMRLFGYRNQRLLFLPFVGAVTIGQNDDATPTQKLIIYFLGPIPGILVGIVALYLSSASADSRWFELATMALLVNGFNLLPILPLDGGRIVETLLFSRLPRARLGFVLLSLAVTASGAWWLHDPLLWMVALLLALTVPNEWRFARAVPRVARVLGDDTSVEERLRATLRILARAPFYHQPAAQRLQLAKSLLHHFGPRRPSLQATLIGGTTYALAAALLVAPAFYQPRTVPPQRPAVAQQPERGGESVLARHHTGHAGHASHGLPRASSHGSGSLWLGVKQGG